MIYRAIDNLVTSLAATPAGYVQVKSADENADPALIGELLQMALAQPAQTAWVAYDRAGNDDPIWRKLVPEAEKVMGVGGVYVTPGGVRARWEAYVADTGDLIRAQFQLIPSRLQAA